MLNYNIMDHSGKVIMSGNEQYLNSVQLKVTSLANGIYFIRLATDKTVYFVKFIKKQSGFQHVSCFRFYVLKGTSSQISC